MLNGIPISGISICVYKNIMDPALFILSYINKYYLHCVYCPYDSLYIKTYGRPILYSHNRRMGIPIYTIFILYTAAVLLDIVRSLCPRGFLTGKL